MSRTDLEEFLGRSGKEIEFNKELHPRGRGGKFARRLSGLAEKAKKVTNVNPAEAEKAAQAAGPRKNESEVDRAREEGAKAEAEATKIEMKVEREQRRAELSNQHVEVKQVADRLHALKPGQEHTVGAGAKVKRVGRRTFEVKSAHGTERIKSARWAARSAVEHKDRHETAQAVGKLKPGEEHVVKESRVKIRRHEEGHLEVTHADPANVEEEATSKHQNAAEAVQTAHTRAILRDERLAPDKALLVKQQALKADMARIGAITRVNQAIPEQKEKIDKLNPDGALGDIGPDKAQLLADKLAEKTGMVPHPINVIGDEGAKVTSHADTLHGAIMGAEHATRLDPGVIGHGHAATDLLTRAAAHVPAEQHHAALRGAAHALQHFIYGHGDLIVQHGEKVAHVLTHLIHAKIDMEYAEDSLTWTRARARHGWAVRKLEEANALGLVESFVHEFNKDKHPRGRGGRFRGVEHLLGVTPYRGKGKAKDADYFQTTRYAGYENFVRDLAKQQGLNLREIRRGRGVWKGGGEPSTQVLIEGGSDASLRKFMDAVGANFQQDGVLRFKPDPKGKALRYVSDKPVSREAVEQHIGKYPNIFGATITPDGRVEVVDLDGSGATAKQVSSLMSDLGQTFSYHHGDGELREAGTHYTKRLRSRRLSENAASREADDGRPSGSDSRGDDAGERRRLHQESRLQEAVAERREAEASGDGARIVRARARERVLREGLFDRLKHPRGRGGEWARTGHNVLDSHRHPAGHGKFTAEIAADRARGVGPVQERQTLKELTRRSATLSDSELEAHSPDTLQYVAARLQQSYQFRDKAGIRQHERLVGVIQNQHRRHTLRAAT